MNPEPLPMSMPMPMPLPEVPAAVPAAAEAVPAERRRRPELARAAPLRQASGLLRKTVAVDAGPAAAGDPAAAAEDPVALGVRLGYQVIEEQILRGQKLAQRLGRGTGAAMGAAAAGLRGAAADAADAAGAAGAGHSSSSGSSSSGEVNELISRVMHLYKDFGALCVDAAETLARNPLLRAGVARMAGGGSSSGEAAAPGSANVNPHAAAAAGANAGPAAHGFALDIRCSRRTQVTLDLGPRAGRYLPRVHALHAADPALAPLTRVQFHADPALPTPLLELTIADTHPAATYTGVVVDSASNEPRGTLSVRLLP